MIYRCDVCKYQGPHETHSLQGFKMCPHKAVKDEFTDIELDTVDIVKTFLAKVPDQYQAEARAALRQSYKLGFDDGVKNGNPTR